MGSGAASDWQAYVRSASRAIVSGTGALRDYEGSGEMEIVYDPNDDTLTRDAHGDRHELANVTYLRPISRKHADQHRPERPVLLGVDQQLGEGAPLGLLPTSPICAITSYSRLSLRQLG